jgi:hypothetical protein
VIKIKNTYRIPKVAFDEWLNKLTKTAWDSKRQYKKWFLGGKAIIN